MCDVWQGMGREDEMSIKRWTDVHPPALQKFVGTYGAEPITPDNWETIMEDFRKMTLDEKLELILWLSAMGVSRR